MWGEGSDRVALFDEKTRERELEDLTRAQEWRATKFDAGFGWITGPAQYGGRELTNAHERIWATLEGQYDVPNQAFFGIGLGMIAPTLLAHGSAAAKDRYLAGMYRGDVVACQLFSEPGRRLGPGQPPDQGRAGRGRVARHRPEGLDVGRAVLGHRGGALPDRSRPCPSTRGSRGSSSTCGRLVSRSGRCAR